MKRGLKKDVDESKYFNKSKFYNLSCFETSLAIISAL